MKNVWKCLVLLTLTLCLLATSALAETTYGVSHGDKVKVRREPNTNANVLFSVNEGYVAEILDDVTVNGETWYKISGTNPEPDGYIYTGYIHGDYFRKMSREEANEYLAGQGLPTLAPTLRPSTDVTVTDPVVEYDAEIGGEATNALGEITSHGVNVRALPTVNSAVLTKLNDGAEVELLTIPPTNAAKCWYKVKMGEQVGYVQADYIDVVKVEHVDLPDLEPAEYIDIIGPKVEDSVGTINGSKVSFRLAPGTDGTKIGELTRGQTVELLTMPPATGSAYWYRVRFDNQVGYVQSTFVTVKKLGDLTEETTPPAGSEETPAPSDPDDLVGATGSVTADNVSLRKGPSTDYQRIAALNEGTVVELLSIPEEIGGWFKVRYNGEVGYISGGYVRIIDRGNAATPPVEEETTTPPATETYTPAPGDLVGATGSVTADNVSMRKGPSTDYKRIFALNEGTVVELLSIPDVISSQNWYKVRYNGEVGYIVSNYVRVIDRGNATEPPIDPGEEEDTDPPAVETQTPAPSDPDDLKGATGSVTADGVNLRQGPGTDYAKLGKLNEGTVVELLSIPSQINSQTWYKVRYNGVVGYVQSNYIRVIEYGNTPTPPPSYYGYAKLIPSNCNLRDEAGGETMAQWNGKGTLMQVMGPSETAKGYEWYPVYYEPHNEIYFVREDMVTIIGGPAVEETTPPPTESAYGYVKVTEAGANLFLKPNGESVEQIKLGTVLPCIGYPVSPEDSQYTWYYVQHGDVRGYLRGDTVVVCNSDGSSLTDPTPTPTPDYSKVYGYIKMTSNKVYIRQEPGGTTLGTLKEGTILPIVGETKRSGSYDWYLLRTPDGIVGYVREDMLMLCDENGNKLTNTPTPTPTPTPDEGEDKPVESSYGYVQIDSNTVNLRSTPSTESNSTILRTLKRGTIWPMVGNAVKIGSYTWYPIQANGDVGYVRNDVAFKLSPEQEAEYLGKPVPTPDPDTVKSNYITVTGNSVNLRAEANEDCTIHYTVKKGTVMPFIGTRKVGTKTWYNVVYEGLELWIHGNYARVMSMAEYNEWLGGNESEPLEKLGYLRFTSASVNVRNAANGSTIIDTLKRGTVVEYYKEAIFAGGKYWYCIKTPAGEMGYSCADYLEKCDENGNDLPLVTPEPGSPDGGNSQQEASYTTLKKGNTGKKVLNLVNELKNQGYYTGTVTDEYTSEVVAAVKAFQQAKGLTVDGVAGSSTQHKLFGTVPIGQGNHNDVTFNFYPVEKIDWFTGGIQEMIPRGANFKVYDIKTGMVWWAHRWAGGYHADIEPLTAADTAKLCKMYGVDDASQINYTDHWHRRPSLVTIGTRTFACSLDGVPHNPDGDTIPDNKMTGQICLHFTNSKGHESGVVSTSHTAAIEEAYAWGEKNIGVK